MLIALVFRKSSLSWPQKVTIPKQIHKLTCVSFRWPFIYLSDHLCQQVAWIHFERSAILTVHSQVITRNPRVGGKTRFNYSQQRGVSILNPTCLLMAVSHENHRTWHLHLNDVQESDRGRYLCQINTAATKTQSGYLNIVGKIIQTHFCKIVSGTFPPSELNHDFFFFKFVHSSADD